MQPVQEPLLFQPHLSQRFKSLIWSCLDSDLVKSAVFYAERYFFMDQQNHDARHLYATTLLRAGQTFSALHLVELPADARCSGCLEVKARCCSTLGRHRKAREALEESLDDANYTPSLSMGPRTACAFPDEAALRCRSGITAMKGNLQDKAAHSFRQALGINPMLWEAFEGLCALGSIPEVDELFPPKPPPVKRAPPEDVQLKSFPVPSGSGLFTPDTGNAGNLFRGWKPDPSVPQPFRMGPPPAPRDPPYVSADHPPVLTEHQPSNPACRATNDSSFYQPDSSFLQVHSRTTRPPTSTAGLAQLPTVSRPLSSADEGGPAPKKLRPTTRQRSTEATTKSSKPPKSVVALEDPLKKARARPALNFANFFSSGRRSQPAKIALGKSDRIQPSVSNLPTRRSTRLLSGNGSRQSHTVKHPPSRDRRRAHHRTRSRSQDSDMDEDVLTGEVTYSPSPPSVAPSPHSEASPAPSNWTSAHELAAQEAYDLEQADYYLYEIMRRFASATRALAMYDCQLCLDELGRLPPVHQQSTWVLAMVGRAHYEKSDYASAERAFKAVRALDPYRIWDMEVYSTLLWHLQRTVELSFLAQELLNIDPKCAPAWIAVGNLFSLQKERAHAMTCFRRAAQMDPLCAYAYTLSGHECIDEDLDKAIASFQAALRADPRHYNAWYGLGTCYLRMSKIRLAEYHYRKAVEIHPNNAVLLGCVGMAVERRGDRDGALKLFDEAVRLSPDNALVRYRRAKILISTRRYQLGIADLEYLRGTSPDESNVIFQLAKAYRLVGDETKSAQLLALARDISPKSMNKIKRLIETVKDEEAGDDQMDEG